MCGRFTLRTPLNKVLAELGLDLQSLNSPRYNISPSQEVVVLKQGAAGPTATSMRWGFLPGWAKDPAKAMINARAESAADKPTFRDAFRKRRCLLPADGFYEWKKVGKKKEPFFLQRADNRSILFAGIWEEWQEIETCAILTTNANSLLAPLHDRMPVIIDSEHARQWLDPMTKSEDLQSLLVSYPSEQMSCTAVSTRVNSPAYDGPECLEPPAAERTLF